MHSLHLAAQDPFDRFRDIYLALDGDACWWSDGAWLRFAAQAAVLSSRTPLDTAQAIRVMADHLKRHAHWYEALSSPLNLVVAATLVRNNESVDTFNAEMTSSFHMLHEAGLSLGGTALIKTVLAMRTLSEGVPMSAEGVQRIRQLYGIMKSKHWWIIGTGDICVCALLASSNGLSPVIAGIAEAIYLRLLDRGFSRGHHVLIAANILSLANSAPTTAADHFLTLIDRVHSLGLALVTENYDALALLSLLGHEPERIAVRLDIMMKAMQALKPLPCAAINVSIAADLVFLEMVRLDGDLHELCDPAAIERKNQLIRYQSAISLMMVDVPQVQLLLAPSM